MALDMLGCPLRRLTFPETTPSRRNQSREGKAGVAGGDGGGWELWVPLCLPASILSQAGYLFQDGQRKGLEEC